MSREVTEQPNQLSVIHKSEIDRIMFDTKSMEQISKFAEIMSTGRVTVPKHFHGSTGDCFAVCLQAVQWGMSPFSVAQQTSLINGIMSYSAQLVNSVVSSSKAVVGRFKYEYGGDWSVHSEKQSYQSAQGKDVWKTIFKPDAHIRCGAVIHGETEITWGEPLYPIHVRTQNSPLWQTAPKQQAAYLAVKYWSRLYTPDVILGVYSADEFEEVEKPERDITPEPVQAPEPARPALPEYTQEDFEAKLEEWYSLIETGKANAAHILRTVSTRIDFTGEQVKKILELDSLVAESQEPAE